MDVQWFLKALKAVKDETLPNTLIAGANVQEEVGYVELVQV